LNHLHVHRASRVALCALACASGLFVASCYQIPTRHGVTVDVTSTGKLEKKNPLEIVMEPVENTSGNANAPLDELRLAFQRGLVKRRYSPLSLERVDEHLLDGAYQTGALQEDADVHVKIDRWDTSLWETHTALLVKAEMRITDPRDPSAGDLWSGRIDHRYEFGSYREKFSSDQALMQFACDRIADEILSVLPPRTAAPGTSSSGH
jgi:hypothetical protein